MRRNTCNASQFCARNGTAVDRCRQVQTGVAQEQFAEALDISVDFLSVVERGRSAPSFETLETMSKRRRLSVADLFGLDSTRVPSHSKASQETRRL